MGGERNRLIKGTVVTSWLVLLSSGIEQLPSVSSRGATIRPGRPLFGDLDVNFEDLDGSSCRIGIVKTRWNPKVLNYHTIPPMEDEEGEWW